MVVMTKICKRCKKEKNINEFGKDNAQRDGKRYICKVCDRESSRKRYALNKEKKLEVGRQYYKNNRKKRLESVARYRKTERGKFLIRKRSKEYYRKNRHKALARGKLNYEIRVGRMKKGVCAVCGDTNTHGHHEDYSKPLEVIWLCKKHHQEFHNDNKRNEK